MNDHERERYEAYESLTALYTEARAEVERLRGLIKQAEWIEDTGLEANYCPWCGSKPAAGHADDCPAFTPEGEVR